MRLQIIAVGKMRNKAMRTLVDDYFKRLARYTRAEMIEVREARKVEAGNTAHALEEEGRALLGAASKGATLIAMHEYGPLLTSKALSDRVQRHMTYEPTDMSFLIGGALGFHPSVLEACAQTLSLSKMTLPHEMARVVLVEQLYRAMTIMRGEPYHK